jgi:hypothetical protein
MNDPTFCNYCREITDTKEWDCQKCGLSKPGDRRSFTITELSDGRWMIEERNGASIYPSTLKPNAREMIARLMQLANVGPVAPQTTPESIGLIDTDICKEMTEETLENLKTIAAPVRLKLRTLEDKMRQFPTVHGDNCEKCGNPWFFDMSKGPVKLKECTTCGASRL